MATATKQVNQNDVPTKQLLARFEEAKEARKKYDSTWERNMNLYKSRAWNGIEKIAWFQSEPQYNKVFEYVEIMRGFLSDNKWGIDVVPASLPPELQKAVNSGNDDKTSAAVSEIARKMGGSGGNQPEIADLQELLNVKASRVSHLLDFIWMDARMQSKLSAMMLHLFLKGTGLFKVAYDPDGLGDSGMTQIETTVIDPFYFYPDPTATSMHDGSFYIEKHPVSRRWVIEHYPDKAQEFLASMGESSMDVAPRGNQGVSKARNSEGKLVDILECWYRDSSVMEDEEGAIKAQYPNGRYTLMTDKGVALEDRPNEYADLAPYVRCVEIPVPNEFWGDCTVDKVADIQLLINQLLRAIVDNGLWMVHGIWVADDTSGVTPESLAGYGMRDVVVKRAGSEVRRDVGEPLPNTIFQTYQDAVEAFDVVAGIPNVMRGIVPSRQPVETTQLQKESGEVRTRERSRRVEESLEDLGKMWLSIVANFWADKKAIRNKRSVGGFDMFQLSKKDMEGWDFDLFVLPGSTTPLDTQSAFDRAKMMRLELGIEIPDELFIRLAQIPGLETAMAQVNADANAAMAANADAAPVTPDEFAGMDAPPDQQGEGDQFPAPEDSIDGAQAPIGQFP